MLSAQTFVQKPSLQEQGGLSQIKAIVTTLYTSQQHNDRCFTVTTNGRSKETKSGFEGIKEKGMQVETARQ